MKPAPAALPDNRLRRPLDAVLGDVHPDWAPVVRAWRDSPAGHGLARFMLARQMAGADIAPARPMRALEVLAPSAVRVVIIGQDPYHGPGQAEGLAFSVPDGVPIPPSLRNIRQEVERTLGRPMRHGGSLAGWARQGVLLLNSAMTVELGQPASHSNQGWEALTERIAQRLCASGQPLVWMLWGAHAQSRAVVVPAAGAPHLLRLACNHPSPLSARRGAQPFIGCRHFEMATAFLQRLQPTRPALDWAGAGPTVHP
ncbi:MAG: uracil-DNA glycosylase [Aquabacterium sp.]